MFYDDHAHKVNVPKLGKWFTTILDNQFDPGTLLLAFMSHIRHSTKHFDTQRMQNIIFYIFLTF